MDCYSLLRPALFRLPAEKAHDLALTALRLGAVPACRVTRYPVLATTCFGLRFPSPIGMAAGFDKNAEATDALLRQGFGCVEAGTVTPRPQAGNPQPRLFRLTEDEAVVNRLGFNNKGVNYVRTRLQRRDAAAGIVGINIGKNKETEEALADYRIGVRELAPHADYVTVNISSPNTAGLRDLQRKEALTALLEGLLTEREKLPRRVPLLVKIAPDLTPPEQEDVAGIARNLSIDGLIIGNTTLSRPDSLRSGYKTETGGLSGKPLMPLATEVLRRMYRLTEGEIPLVGVGGIASPEDAVAKIRAGASLLQLYSALVYQGFGLVERIQRGLAAEVERAGVSGIADLVGAEA